MDSNELLEKFERDLPNTGKWSWEGNEGARPRTLTVVQKLLKAGVSEKLISEIVTDLYFTAFVEYEKCVLKRTGVRVKDIPNQSTKPIETKPDAEISSTQAPVNAS